MQQAIPYKAWRSTFVSPGGAAVAVPPQAYTSSGVEVVNNTKNLRKLVAENAVVVLGRKGCCMCHVVKLLLHGHGVNPTILDVYEQNEADVTNELSGMIGVVGGPDNAAAAPQFPAVFVGGKLFGGLEDIMGAHISGELVPRLREAGALWL